MNGRSGEFLSKFCTNQIPSRKTRVVPFKAPESEVMLSTQSADVDLWPAKACEQKRSPTFFSAFLLFQQSLPVGKIKKFTKKFKHTYEIQDMWNQFSSSEIFNVNLSWVQSYLTLWELCAQSARIFGCILCNNQLKIFRHNHYTKHVSSVTFLRIFFS